jgi:hypothetical protein
MTDDNLTVGEFGAGHIRRDLTGAIHTLFILSRGQFVSNAQREVAECTLALFAFNF